MISTLLQAASTASRPGPSADALRAHGEAAASIACEGRGMACARRKGPGRNALVTSRVRTRDVATSAASSRTAGVVAENPRRLVGGVEFLMHDLRVASDAPGAAVKLAGGR